MGTTISEIKSFMSGTVGYNDNKVTAKDTSDLFAKAMAGASVEGAQGIAKAQAEVNVLNDTGRSSSIEKFSSNSSKINSNIEDASNTSKQTVRNELSKDKDISAIEDKTSKIKDKIKEETGLSDEELEEAMASLSMTAMDLLNSDKVKELMMSLSGETDAISLLTNEDLFNSIKNISDFIGEIVNEINDELGIDISMLEPFAGELEQNVSFDELVNVDSLSGENVGEAELSSDANTEITNAVAALNSLSDSRNVDATSEKQDGPNVIVNKENDGAEVANTVETSERASLDKKTSEMMNDRNSENDSSQMFSQNIVTTTDSAGNVVETVTEFATSYVDNEEIFNQVKDSIKVNISADVTSMEMQLHPASLGTVNLQIASQNGTVTAQLQVQNEAVKAVIEGQLVQLLETFEEQGQKVEAIEVSVAGYDLDRSLNQNSEQGNSERREDGSISVGRVTRRRLNLSELDEEELAELSDEEQLAAEMMTMNGTTLDYMA